ncbi:MAG: hypothetical protein JW738_02520 [Actinobacteria bacterium]|nr:hypothetical protein [Actinomycetota bacterium]
MRKKILVIIVSIGIIAALAAVFTGAQFFKVTTTRNSLLTFGNIEATAYSPDPLMSLTNIVPGETRSATVYLRPLGTINQDIWIGLQDEEGQDPATFGEVLTVRRSLDGGATWTGWKTVHEYFTDWQKVASNIAPNTLITVDLQIRVPMDLGPEYMNVNYYFKTFIDAVQTGGTPPATAPYLFTP